MCVVDNWIFPIRQAIAGIEQDEDVGADKGIVAALDLASFGNWDRLQRAVGLHVHRRFVAIGERRELLRNAVFKNPEILRLQAIDVVPFVVGDGEAQHHHVHLHPECWCNDLLYQFQ